MMKKSKRTCGVREGTQDEDRLSALPDDVLTHILSFLHTKYVINMSLLSKRWKNIWKSIPSLNLTSQDFQKLASFDKFVQAVVRYRDGTAMIDSFSFRRRSIGKITYQHFEKVMKYATSHGVQDLDISFGFEFNRVADLPACICSSSTLKTLKLEKDYIKLPLAFKALTSLHLRGVGFLNSELFSSCPSLLDLTLFGCKVFVPLKELNISTPQLARLAILDCNVISGCKIVLSLPKLTSFIFCGWDYLSFSSVDLPLLHMLSVDLGNYKSIDAAELIDMFQYLHNAQSVRLSMGVVEILSTDTGVLEYKPSPFANLKTLKFFSRTHTSFRIPVPVMNYFLKNSPHAEIVTELV